MFTPDKTKLRLAVFLGLGLYLLGPAVSSAQQSAGGASQEYKNKITQLKNQRDAEIAALIRQRDSQMLTLQQKMTQVMRDDISKINKDKAIIEQKMRQGQDMKGPLRLLAQQEQAMRQKSAALQQQINKIKLTYDQQIQKITQAYAQMFTNLQQQMTAQGIR